MDILIPCKSLSLGKSRLATVLEPAQRRRLCRCLLVHTLDQALASGARVAVVTEDPAVVRFARRHGAQIIDDPGAGLNAALIHGNAVLGYDAPLIVMPIDLPGLTAAHVARLTLPTGLSLVPDRRQEGTNLLLLAPAARPHFTFAFGPKSFTLHHQAAVRQGLPVTVQRDAALEFDIDTPEDLACWPGLISS
ncbi:MULTISPECIES: 2-phospho-L-lactate guanylyltransferase [unclassified Chelatococcus]|uniref:2-phospho-L-lactate guanylyltransferase n=1 Tax=unclassified Chelatococcus TaxID=2638111 RepID=UPI001BD084E8|nr:MULTISPECIES: 2-phospho-L-lactate guanylyltransferase [unclassified Chelatococcus]MBS7700252.1 2-phospho-L-lactate guanylyltransferase [Chelatococcus sp. YT9]MBX3558223.1 2-phospho-L-lactate guanylyltransferase [Chelatococcus sp.]